MTYTNGIEREVLDEPDFKAVVRVLSAVRQGNGRWSVVLDIDGEVLLSDGRTIDLRRRVNLNCRQVGRKRQPNKKAKE